MPENATDNERRAIDESARQWVQEIHMSALSDERKAAFEAWIAASPAHGAAYKALEQAWRDLALIDGLEDAAALPKANMQIEANDNRVVTGVGRLIMRPVAFAASLMVVAGLSVWIGTGFLPAPEPSYYASNIGQIKQIGLNDGSVLTLDTGAAVNVRMLKGEREVELLRGRVRFDVAKDSTRPFIVENPYGSVTVTGTIFDVWARESSANVSVIEGSVLVAAKEAASPNEPIALVANEAAWFNGSAGWAALPYNENLNAMNWGSGRLSFVDAALVDVLAEVNRYRTLPLVLDDASLGALTVTLSFKTDQQDQFLVGLEAALPIDLRRDINSIKIVANPS